MRLRPKPGAHRPRHARSLRSLRSRPRPSLPRQSPSRRPRSVPSLARLTRRRPTVHRGVRRRPSLAHLLSAPFSKSDERPLERRRARALLLAAVLFATVVLLTALPWSTLLSQHTQLSSDTAEVNQLQVENRALAAQARQLSNSATQQALARQDYGLVKPGQTAYDILPAPGSSAATTDSGHVPLNEAPVVPGSRRSEELLDAGVVSAPSSSASTPTSAGQVHAQGGRGGPSSTGDAGGFWTRVGHTLEFWN
jgi:cell division protein FtsB